MTRDEKGVVAVPAQGPAHLQQLQDWPDSLWHAFLHDELFPLQYGVSWHTEMFCSEQSLSSYVHLVYQHIGHGRSAESAGSPRDCST